MNLDSVTVSHVITVDFGPDRRSRWCKTWDWLRDNEAESGVKRYSFTGSRQKKNFETVRRDVKTCLEWLSLLLTTALFIAIHVYAGGGA